MSQHQDYLDTRYFPALDGVRCFCILAVIWHHVPHPDYGLRLLNRGFLGVDMFFILSGFLIVTLLVREKERTQDINLAKFYWRRSLRIFPAYYLLLGLFACLYFLKGQDTNSVTFFQTLPYYLTFTSNFSATQAANFAILWSLAMEGQFYAIWPSLEKYFPPKTCWLLLAGAVVINQGINFGLLDNFILRYFGTVDLSVFETTFTPILLGVSLAYLLHSLESFNYVKKISSYFWLPLLYSLALLIYIQFSPNDISGYPRLLIQIGMTLLLASIVIPTKNCFSCFLTVAPIARIGLVSYGMYLYHMWGIHVVTAVGRKLGINHWMFILLCSAAITYCLAEISFKYWEKPFLNMKNKFKQTTC